MCARKRKRRRHHSRVTASTTAPSQKFFQAPYGLISSINPKKPQPFIKSFWPGSKVINDTIELPMTYCRKLLGNQSKLARIVISRYMKFLPGIKSGWKVKQIFYKQQGNFHEYRFELAYRVGSLRPRKKWISVGLYYVAPKTGTKRWWNGYVAADLPLFYFFDVDCPILFT